MGVRKDLIGRVFKVLDSHGRFWGTFMVKKETEFFGSHNIHGTLIPSEDFELVRPLFNQHELGIEKGGEVDEVNINEILELKTYLVDDESGVRVNVHGALFITQDLLVTCGVE